MKKRQIWIIGIAVWQAIALFQKDKELREKVQAEQWLLGKLKLMGEWLLQENKQLYKEISETDWDKTIESLEKNVTHDSATIQQRAKNQENKDREEQWRTVIREVIDTIPDKKTLADWAEKYKNRIMQRWNNL